MASNDEILTTASLSTHDWITHWLPELNANQVTMLERYINGLRADEVEAFADYLTDMPTQAAFEMGVGEYSYKRIRFIHAEGDGNDHTTR